MNGIWLSAVAVAGAEASYRSRVQTASREFEGVLLGSLLRSLEQSFSCVPGDQPKPAGADDYQFIGTEAFAAALAQRGGLGIAQTISRKLLQNMPPQSSQSDAGSTKVLSPSADIKSGRNYQAMHWK